MPMLKPEAKQDYAVDRVTVVPREASRSALVACRPLCVRSEANDDDPFAPIPLGEHKTPSIGRRLGALLARMVRGRRPPRSFRN